MNIEKSRKQTPATDHLIHLNNAGSSLSPDVVTKAVVDHLALEQKLGGYEAQAEAQSRIDNFYHAFARLLNCTAQEIAYTDSASRSWLQVFNAIPFRPGDHILTDQSEYASNYLAMLQLAQKKKVVIDVIPNTEQGDFNVAALENRITDKVRLIALTHVPSQSGVIHPAAAVGKIARKHDILFLLDACQSAGQINLDVEELCCDMLTGTGRKYLRGPRGTGFLYVRQAILDQLEPAGIDLHSAQWLTPDSYRLCEDARRFELWEGFIAGKIGLGVAADYAVSTGMSDIEKRVCSLAAQLRRNLSEIPGISLHDQGTYLSGICTFSSDRMEAQELKMRLAAKGINLSVSRKVNSRLDFAKDGLEEICRASVHYYNTSEELEIFCEQLSALVKKP